MATLLCPVMVGRDDLLSLVGRRVDEARSGSGHLLFLAGEAGIGKTRLLGSAMRRAARAGLMTVTAATFACDTELAGGLLLDLAANLRSAAATEAVGERIATRLAEDPSAGGDRHRRRRTAVLDVAALVAGLADDGPILLALEDLHWADDLSLEVVAQLARRLAGRPMLVVGTYRSDELYPRVPMREWRGTLLRQRLAEEARLSRLSLDETTLMIRSCLGSPAVSEEMVAAIYARSDGIPLHVEEFLDAAGGPRRLPQTLRDAVVSRAERLSPGAAAAAGAAAVIGRSFSFDLLAEVAGTDVAGPLRELEETGFIEPGAESTTYDFRHALIRDTFYDDLSVPTRRRLHARVVHAAARHGIPDAVLSVHCEQANLRDDAHRLAWRAASEASRLSSHREAFELLRRAVRCQPSSLDPIRRADLLASLATEAAAADDNVAADEAFERGYGLYMAAGRTVPAAALVAPWTAVRHLLGDDLASRVDRLTAGLAQLSGLVSPEADEARVALLSGLSAAYMLDRRLEEAIDYGEQALALAPRAVGEVHVAATLGSVLVFAGRDTQGWPMLESAVTQARAAHREAEAARAYRMLGSTASVVVEYERALAWLPAGIEYAERADLANHRHYLVAHLAHVQWATGDWTAADATARAALVDGRGGVTTRITALHVLGYLALGRGNWADARAQLEEARSLGEQMRELQRLSPALWGLAEAALLQSDVDGAVAGCERGLAASRQVQDAAYLYPYLVTGTRAFLRAGDPAAAGDWVERAGELVRLRSIPGTLPALTQARGLVELAAGRPGSARDLLAEAAAGWASRRRFWEGAFCRLDLARALQRSKGSAQALGLVAGVRSRAAELGAAPLVEAAAAVAAPQAEVPAWHPLSVREFEVAGLIAEGLTNREVAARLVVAPKTASAHVEHILAKLGVSRRAEIAVWVATVRSATR